MASWNFVSKLNFAAQQLVNLWKRWFSRILPYQPMKGDEEILNNEYSEGYWDYLRGSSELPRFCVVAGYCHYFKEGGSILEIGCGEGILQEKLNPSQYSRYVGVDISAEAISRASSKQSDKISFIVSDASSFSPDEKFDIVVFNECLEYFDDPLSLVKDYESFLKNNGLFIVSMFVGTDTVRTKRIWKLIESSYILNETAKVTTKTGYSWIIKVFNPLK